jgi:DNA polymerase-1
LEIQKESLMMLLIDADIIVYRTACAVETKIDWGDGEITYDADYDRGVSTLESLIARIGNKFGFPNMLFCFSDKRNFRKNIFPEYKSNRVGIHRPILLKQLREYVEDKYLCRTDKFLEADDLLGIIATSEGAEEKIIVTIDKDLYQIPVDVYNFVDDTTSKAKDRDGQRLHYMQMLTGDTVDGYKGCPGVGSKAAIDLLGSPHLCESYEHTFKRGSRTGETETRWRQGEPCTIWEAIVSRYEKAGLTEEDALVQAQISKILQNEDYPNDKIKLWRPTK